MSGSIDDRLAIWIATHRVEPLNGVFVRLGTIEKLGAVWIALAVVVGIVQRRGVLRTAGLGVLTAVVVFAADAASFGIKDLVDRPRPFAAHPRIQPLYHVHSGSFPAGHAATAFAGAVLLSFAAPRATALFALLATAIGFSRVYVGDHYPGDVVGGAMLGALVAIAALALVRAADDRGLRVNLGAWRRSGSASSTSRRSSRARRALRRLRTRSTSPVT